MVHKHPSHLCLYTHRLECLIVQDKALQRAPLIWHPFYPCVCGGGGGLPKRYG